MKLLLWIMLILGRYKVSKIELNKIHFSEEPFHVAADYHCVKPFSPSFQISSLCKNLKQFLKCKKCTHASSYYLWQGVHCVFLLG